MIDIKHILFPIDFSERACRAAPFVKAMATQFGARVTLMSVAPHVICTGAEVVLPPVVVSDRELKADLESRLNSALKPELSGIPVETVAEVGDPATAIVAFAHNQSVDLIMMPTHGYGPFRRMLLGSVAAKVLHDVDCPVWTGAHAGDTPGHAACRRVLCALDRSISSLALVRWAAQFAQQAGADLRLVHVIQSDGWPGGPEHRDFEEFLRERAREEIQTFGGWVGAAPPLCLPIGKVEEAVREEAARHAADLIVIGRGAIQNGHGRLRAHAYGIVREAPCPVISV
jgi:nucleotide-binding universal stress UspA family protein